MKGIFFDIFKAFDKVWHATLIFKLNTLWCRFNHLKLLNRSQTKRCFKRLKASMAIYFGRRTRGVCVRAPFDDLPEVIASISKIFADDTSLFSKVNDKNNCNTQLNSDLGIINKWGFQWKMLFNPDINKQAIKVCFSIRCEKKKYPPLIFNSTNIQSAFSQKHLGLILD